MWSLLPGGLLIQGQLTGNKIPLSPGCSGPPGSRTGGHLFRVVALTGFTALVASEVQVT